MHELSLAINVAFPIQSGRVSSPVYKETLHHEIPYLLESDTKTLTSFDIIVILP